jgi:hypothetical protein
MRHNKQTQYPWGITGQQRKLCLLKKMLGKSFTPFLDILHCCSLFIVLRSSFSLDLLAGYSVSGCYEVTRLLHSCRGYRHPAKTTPYHEGNVDGRNASHNWAGPNRNFTTWPWCNWWSASVRFHQAVQYSGILWVHIAGKDGEDISRCRKVRVNDASRHAGTWTFNSI